MVQPVGVTANLVSFNTNSRPANLINQSGLSQPYTSLGIDFATYVATTTHNSDPFANIMIYAVNPAAVFDFNLGGSKSIDAVAFWNIGGNFQINVGQFTLITSNDASFANSVTLGTFNPSAGGPLGAAPGQVFNFGPTTASFVRMKDITVAGRTSTVAFSEVAFREVSAVPEPASLTMVCLGAVCFGVARAWRRRTASVSGRCT
jgi:hypothetical protein